DRRGCRLGAVLGERRDGDFGPIRDRAVLRPRRVRLRVRGPAGVARLRVPGPPVPAAGADDGAGRVADAAGGWRGRPVVARVGPPRAPAEWRRSAGVVGGDGRRGGGDRTGALVVPVRPAVAPPAGRLHGPDGPVPRGGAARPGRAVAGGTRGVGDRPG